MLGAVYIFIKLVVLLSGVALLPGPETTRALLPIVQVYRKKECNQKKLDKAVELLKPLKHKISSFPLL